MRVEVLGGVERRRRWSRDDKMRIIEETLAPGAGAGRRGRKRPIDPSAGGDTGPETPRRDRDRAR